MDPYKQIFITEPPVSFSLKDKIHATSFGTRQTTSGLIKIHQVLHNVIEQNINLIVKSSNHISPLKNSHCTSMRSMLKNDVNNMLCVFLSLLLHWLHSFEVVTAVKIWSFCLRFPPSASAAVHYFDKPQTLEYIMINITHFQKHCTLVPAEIHG